MNESRHHHRVFAATLSLLSAALPCAAEGGVADSRDVGAPVVTGGGFMSAQSVMERPPDDGAVIAREFRGAVDDGSSAALIRFIARHPDHALASDAWALLDRKSAPDPGLLGNDPDAVIYAAFDAARRAGTIGAYQMFASLYPNHPLTQVADSRIRALR